MQVIQIQSAADIISIDDWDKYLQDGEQFMGTAIRAYETKKKAFSPEVLYNLVCMAIEKYVMATLMKNGDLAENHTMQDLVYALERHTGPLEIRDDLLFLGSFQEICDLDTAVYATPTDEDMAKIMDIGKRVETLLRNYLVAA